MTGRSCMIIVQNGPKPVRNDIINSSDLSHPEPLYVHYETIAMTTRHN